MTRKLWAAQDGNGGYDIGEGDFTIASVRNIKAEDGVKVQRAYDDAFGHTPQETALLFRAAPNMAAALEQSIPMMEAFASSLTGTLRVLAESKIKDAKDALDLCKRARFSSWTGD